MLGLGKKKKKEDAAEDAEEAQEEATEEEAAAEGDGAEGEGDGEEGAAPKKKSKKKVIIIGVVALLLLAGIGAGLYFSGMLGGGDENGVEGGEEEVAEAAVYYTLPEFLINLNTSSRSSSFLKTTVILEVPKQEDIPMIETNMPRLVDAINTYLRELRASDLSGSAGIQRLREELLIRANKALAPVKVNDVLFKEIVIQ
ncbi:MAG: flagellar basal body-associated FliL family protein [Rickettsiales bacterium]